ncbi:MAG TPA: AAA family ATPase [Jiangellaceae bacterium]|nr:AAA family ATPase [Jiangellaceae bacterium]
MELVGRGAELGRIAAALGEAVGGAGPVVGLAGEPGIGKTRLALETIGLAEQRGFVVLAGRAPVREMAVAYAPILEAVGDHLRSLDSVARTALTHGLSELGVLLGSLVGGRPEPLADPALEQARLFEAVARLVERIQDTAPVLVFVDDAHEADAASVSLLAYLCRRLRGQRVLTLLTYRSDADSLRPLREVLTSLRRQKALQEITLEPLTREQLAQIAESQLGGPVSDALLDTLDARAGGIPLFAETLLDGLREAGQLRQSAGRWALAHGAEPDVPAVVRDAILRPLNRLADADRRLADILAVAGEPVAHHRLATLAALDDNDLAEGIWRLRDAGLADEVVTKAQVGYRLRHPLIAEVVYAELSEARRRRVHAALAAELEHDEQSDLQRLARHYRGAAGEADPDRARKVLTAAGAQALGIYANREALTLLGAALELQRAAGHVDRIGEVLEHLGEALERVGEQAAAVGVWEEALQAVTEAGDARAAGRLHRRLAATEWERGDPDKVRAHLARGLELLSTIAPSRELAGLRLTEVWLRCGMNDFQGAAVAVDQLAKLAGQLAAPVVAVEALMADCRVQALQLRPVEALAKARRALEIAESAGDLLLLWRAHDLNASSVVWDGDHAVVRHHAERGLDIARNLGIPGLELRSTVVLAVAEYFAGNWDVMAERIGEVLSRAPLIGHPRAAVQAVATAAVLSAHRGDVAIAERVLAEVETAHGRLEHDAGVQVMLAAAEIEIALSRDRIVAATQLADRTVPAIRSFPGSLLVAAAAAYLRAGRWGDALALTPRIPAMATRPDSAVASEALRIEGVARAGLGDEEAALACLGKAREIASALEIPFLAARAGLDWGRIRRNAEGATAVRESLEVFERLGARLLASDARHLLRALGETPPRRPSTGPLSAREREVACMAAEGLTATQIAERLFISPHTARTHLKRIYERLAVSSRAELTRYVVDAGWLTNTPS